MDRGSNWSITINNPTEQDLNPTLPAKWVQLGQIEQGAEGTVHYQGMVTTPQVRFSAVKKVFPRAHIELARNKVALSKYVQKEETRLESLDSRSSTIPTLFDYNHTIAQRFDMEEFNRQCEDKDKIPSEYVLDYVDQLVSLDIENGVNGVEFIAINPMWRSAWKKFWRSIVKREKLISTAKVEDAVSVDKQIQEVGSCSEAGIYGSSQEDGSS